MDNIMYTNNITFNIILIYYILSVQIDRPQYRYRGCVKYIYYIIYKETDKYYTYLSFKIYLYDLMTDL